MTDNDVKQAIVNFARVSPGYLDWREKHFGALTKSFGTSVAEERDKFFETWRLAIGRHDTSDVIDVLEAMQSGRIEKPFYGDAPQVIAREAQALRDNRTKEGRKEADREEYRRREDIVAEESTKDGKPWWAVESMRVALCVTVSLGLESCEDAESHPLFGEALSRCREKCSRPHATRQGDGPRKLFGNAGVDLSDLKSVELLAGPAKGA